MPEARPVRVWDRVVRLFHWMLAMLVAVDLVRDDGDYAHRLIGYAAVAVVTARLLWAARSRGAGSLGALRPSVSGSIAYLRALLRGHASPPLGHNPLGVWMVWTIWILVLLLGLTGWLSRTDAFWGDEFLEGVHEILADAMLLAVFVHLMGIAAMSWLWRANLPWSMITGRKWTASPPA
jgi:cytochrome b